MHILTLIHKRWGEHLTTTIFNTVQIRGPTAFPVLMGVENPNKRDGNLKRPGVLPASSIPLQRGGHRFRDIGP